MWIGQLLVAIISVLACVYTEQVVYLNKCEDSAKCTRRISINKTFKNQNQKKSEFIRIQKVLDRASNKNFTLINPLILKVYSYLPQQIYRLKLLKIVNNKAHEVFYHEDNTPNFPSCNEDTLNKLCGENGKGFCCSCDGWIDNFPYHIRGGQDCYTNSSSAHCLQYDPLWYSVNELKEPTLYHVVVTSLFSTSDNQIRTVRVGNHLLSAQNDIISVTYTAIRPSNNILDHKQKILLVPQTTDRAKSQLMLLNKSQIGEECDKIGVTVQAFNNQPSRCHKPAQSCLDHQPMNFWLEDMERMLKGKPRKYFLCDKARCVPKIVKSEKSQWSLVVPASDVDIILSVNITADHILMIPQQFKQVIRECVYIDNGFTENLNVILFNRGYLHEDISVQLQGCDVSVSGDLHKSVQLSPHTTQHVQLLFHTAIDDGKFTCTVMIHGENDNYQWEITLKKQHQCVCFPILGCNCGEDGYYRRTLLMKTGLYRGPTDPWFVLCVIMMLLLFLGFVKAVISLWSPITVGELGLCLFKRSRVVSSYQEKILHTYEVVYNERGIPINPVTKEPVQILSTCELFVLNMCFGYYILFIGLHWLILKLLGLDTKYQKEREQKSWHQKLITPVTSPGEKTDACGDVPDTKPATDSHKKSYDITDKQLAYEQYRKQKKELQKYLQKSALEAKASGLSRKLPIQELLTLDHVFFNYQRESPLLKNSGKCFSLCGILCKHGRRYKFELGPYSAQMYENIDGKAEKLTSPRKIIHPVQFITEMNTSAVHQYITTKPLFPCLNTHLTYHNP